jgi:predicted nucleic acid-binding protein
LSKYAVGLNVYQAVRDEFIAGKTAREIGLEQSMEPIHVLGFLKWIAREFEIERIARSDQLKARLLRAANSISSRIVEQVEAGKLEPERLGELLDVIERLRTIFALVSQDDQTWLRERAERRHLWKSGGQSAASNGGGRGGIDELIPEEAEGRRARARPR